MQNNLNNNIALNFFTDNRKYICGLVGVIIFYNLANKLIDNNYNARITLKNSKIEIYK